MKPNAVLALRFDDVPMANAVVAVFQSTPMPGVPGEQVHHVYGTIAMDVRTDHPERFEAWKIIMRDIFKSECALRSGVPEDKVALHKGKFGNQN
jgi:hypothetical protein